MTIPDISSTKGASKSINFCSFGFTETFSHGKKGIDLFKKLSQESHESITPSSLNKCLMPITRSTFS